MSLKAPCIRCGADVRRETAVALVIEVLEDGRVIERRLVFSLHPSCADFKRGALLRWTRHRYQRREVDIRSALMPVDAGAAWIPAA